MKKIFLQCCYLILIFLGTSCSEIQFGDGALSDPPELDGATLETLFSSASNAEKVLVTAYSYLPYGLPINSGGYRPNSSDDYNKLGGNVLEAITDLVQSSRFTSSDGPTSLYYSGSLGTNIGGFRGNQAYNFGGQLDYHAIRYAWIYIENADRIPDISSKDRAEKIAEAKMCIAIAYFEMLRYCGGVPLLKRSIDVNEEMSFPRNTFEETVDYIVQLLDESATDLPWQRSSTTDGRMTKAGALALKMRVLNFAASDTFNSSELFHSSANAYHCYTNYDLERWKRAERAATEFMNAHKQYGFYQLVEAGEASHEAYRLAYRKGYYDRGTSEMVISLRQSYSSALHNEFVGLRFWVGPTLNWVDMFPWADGSEFPSDFDWEKPSKDPFFEGTTPTRDPRLYENVVVPGDTYFNGTLAPLYKEHPDNKSVATGTGFMIMKFILQQTSDRQGKPVHWPYMRYAEVLLNAAEAINEANNGPNSEAYSYLNAVRARVGLPPVALGLSKLAFREALLKERALEFGFEEIRWFDLVRWGLEDEFKKKLFAIETSGIGDPKKPTGYTYKKVEVSTKRQWSSSWSTKWYLSPIAQEEIKIGYGMTQNPGWN